MSQRRKRKVKTTKLQILSETASGVAFKCPRCNSPIAISFVDYGYGHTVFDAVGRNRELYPDPVCMRQIGGVYCDFAAPSRLGPKK